MCVRLACRIISCYVLIIALIGVSLYVLWSSRHQVLSSPLLHVKTEFAAPH